MADSRGHTVTARIGATTSAGEATEWTASGRTITFPGWLAAYGYGGDDDADTAGDAATARLPQLDEGAELPSPTIAAEGHTTQPPARYTEATLVKALEEKGIGRPSTYSSIMGTIQNRGYVWKKGQALVPSTDAFAVVNLLEGHFGHLVDYEFTARMEDDLDEIAEGHQERVPWLGKFWFGNGSEGLKPLCERALAEADAEAINTIPLALDEDGTPVVLRNGRYGPYVKRGEDTASIPDDLPLDELTVERALELLAAPKGTDPIGTDPTSGLPVYAKNGRFGPYVQLGDADTAARRREAQDGARCSTTMTLERITIEEALAAAVAAAGRWVSTPRAARSSPPTDATARTSSGGTRPAASTTRTSCSRSPSTRPSRSSPSPRRSAAAGQRRLVPSASSARTPCRASPIVVRRRPLRPVRDRRRDNASLSKGDTVEGITFERAGELLPRCDASTGPSKPAGRKKAAAKKAAAKKTARKKASKAKKAPRPRRSRAHRRPRRWSRRPTRTTAAAESTADAVAESLRTPPHGRRPRPAGGRHRGVARLAGPARRPPRAPRPGVRLDAFFRLWLAQVITGLGDWLGFLAIVVLAQRVGAGARRERRSAW